jgi:hypothetical protein
MNYAGGVADIRQKRRSGLNTVFTRQPGLGQRRVKLRSIDLCSLDCIGEAYGQRLITWGSRTLGYGHVCLSPDVYTRNHHQRQNVSEHASPLGRHIKYAKKKVKRS